MKGEGFRAIAVFSASCLNAGRKELLESYGWAVDALAFLSGVLFRFRRQNFTKTVSAVCVYQSSVA